MKFNYGEPISPQLADYLKEYLMKADYLKYATKSNWSLQTVERLCVGRGMVNEKNKSIVIDMMRLAVEKRSKYNHIHQKARRFLKTNTQAA